MKSKTYAEWLNGTAITKSNGDLVLEEVKRCSKLAYEKDDVSLFATQTSIIASTKLAPSVVRYVLEKYVPDQVILVLPTRRGGKRSFYVKTIEKDIS